MVYKHKDWTLYCTELRLKEGKKDGKPRNIYFFSKHTPKSGNPCDMPEGYEIGFNKRTEMPYLKYKKGKTSTWKRTITDKK